MARITKVLGWANHDTYALVTVETDKGDECVVIVGGEVETFFHKGQGVAWVKKNKTLANT